MKKSELIIKILPDEKGFSDTPPAIHSDKLREFLLHKGVQLTYFRFSCNN
jgi:hypothetical protein